MQLYLEYCTHFYIKIDSVGPFYIKDLFTYWLCDKTESDTSGFKMLSVLSI